MISSTPEQSSMHCWATKSLAACAKVKRFFPLIGNKQGYTDSAASVGSNYSLL